MCRRVGGINDDGINCPWQSPMCSKWSPMSTMMMVTYYSSYLRHTHCCWNKNRKIRTSLGTVTDSMLLIQGVWFNPWLGTKVPHATHSVAKSKWTNKNINFKKWEKLQMHLITVRQTVNWPSKSHLNPILKMVRKNRFRRLPPIYSAWPCDGSSGLGGKGNPAKGFLGEIFSLSNMQKRKGWPASCFLPWSVGTATLVDKRLTKTFTRSLASLRHWDLTVSAYPRLQNSVQ